MEESGETPGCSVGATASGGLPHHPAPRMVRQSSSLQTNGATAGTTAAAAAAAAGPSNLGRASAAATAAGHLREGESGREGTISARPSAGTALAISGSVMSGECSGMVGSRGQRLRAAL